MFYNLSTSNSVSIKSFRMYPRLTTDIWSGVLFYECNAKVQLEDTQIWGNITYVNDDGEDSWKNGHRSGTLFANNSKKITLKMIDSVYCVWGHTVDRCSKLDGSGFTVDCQYMSV